MIAADSAGSDLITCRCKPRSLLVTSGGAVVLFSPLIDLHLPAGRREPQRPDPVVRATVRPGRLRCTTPEPIPPTTGWRSMLPAGHRCHRR